MRRSHKVGDMGRASDLTTPGYIYFIQTGHGGAIKIGWSSNVTRRIAMLQTGCPDQLSLLHTEPGTGRDERDLHAKFGKYRISGEWFQPHPSILAHIEAAKATPPKEYQAATTRPSRLPAPRLTEQEWAEIRRFEDLPPDYYEPGNPGWDAMVRAVRALD